MTNYSLGNSTGATLLALLVPVLGGCTSNDLYLASYSRVGIDASTDGAGIGGKSGYFNVTPTKKDGSPYTVLGTSDIDASFSDVVIEEVLATGLAAVCAAKQKGTSTEAAEGPSLEAFKSQIAAEMPESDFSQKPPRLVIGSFTSWSLVDLSWADPTSQGITFGYKRSTGMKIPAPQDGNTDIGSAYVNVTINTTADKRSNRTELNGIRQVHTFATGDAAIIVASNNANALNGIDPAAVTNLGCQ